MSTTPEEKLLNTCRSCLLLSDDTYPILETVLQDVTVSEMLNYFQIGIEDDDLPKTICHSCLMKLQAAYNFLQTFKKSQNVLKQNYIKVHEEEGIIVLKTEIVLDDDKAIETFRLDPLNNENVNDTEENIVIQCDGIDKERHSHNSDNADYLIEQSVNLKAPCKLQKYGSQQANSDWDNNSEEIEDSTEQRTQVDESTLSTSKSTNSESLQCPICCKTFKRYPFFSTHLMKHNDKVDCTLCSISFVDADLYLEHYQQNHRYHCDSCSRSFPRGDAYIRHMQVHNKTIPKFACPWEDCPRSFCGRQALQKHYSTMHTEKRNFLCNLCGASFKNSDNLRYHIKKHKGPSHICIYCGKAFMQSTHLKDHMWRHTDKY